MVERGLRVDQYDRRRTDLIKRLPQVLGVTPIAAYLPHRLDLLTSTCPYSGRVWTAEASMSRQMLPQGFGVVRSMNGTSNYLTCPDANDLTFGNGATDSPFTLIHYGRPSSGVVSTFFSKNGNAAEQEYQFFANGAGVLISFLVDDSAVVQPQRVSDAGAPVDSFHTYVQTYDATGGATAANGIVQLVDGAVVSSTATNNASYVAMENKANPGCVGASTGQTARFYGGKYGCLLICSGALSAATVLSTHYTLRGYFGG